MQLAHSQVKRKIGFRAGTISDVPCIVQTPNVDETDIQRQQSEYTSLFTEMENAASEATQQVLEPISDLTEPFVAYEVARTLPPGKAFKITSISRRHRELLDKN